MVFQGFKPFGIVRERKRRFSVIGRAPALARRGEGRQDGWIKIVNKQVEFKDVRLENINNC